jgi:bis(5'-nucleosidyl)-tetraphosphatase
LPLFERTRLAGNLLKRPDGARYNAAEFFRTDSSMVFRTGPTRLSAGVVVVSLIERKLKFLLLRAYRNWDFPKGMVEPGEEPIDAAVREVKEETTLDDISFDWGPAYMETGPYNKGKISRYYIARSKERLLTLPVSPELGVPEHQEARWVSREQATQLVSPRLKPVVEWAYQIITHGSVQ